MTVIAVIPSRMGSVRMPRKNLCEIEPGITLVQQAVDCARYSGVVDQVIVSSDEDIPVVGAELVRQPPEVSGPEHDITDAVAYVIGYTNCDYVVTLQPAVVARSPLIVRNLVECVVNNKLMGGITWARTHRWTWDAINGLAVNDWHPGPYPRSQHVAPRFVEINAVQVAHHDAVLAKGRFGIPFAMLELPPWAAALDIDTARDLAEARDLWPWAKPRLETLTPQLRVFEEIACAR